MITKLIGNCRTTEVDAVAQNITGAYKGTELSTDTYLSGLMTRLETEGVSLTAAIKRMNAESKLEAQDEVRDEAFRGLYYLVFGLLHHPDETIKAAAQQVFAVLDHYGLTITDQSYASESSLVGSALNDLAQPEFQEPIALLSGCAESIAKLTTTEDDFEAARIAFEEEKAQESTLENATTIKKRVVSLINDKLVVYLLAMVQVNPETYDLFARTVGQIIADNNEVVKKRRKKPETAEPVEPAEPAS
ncbi:MAG: hypothetical protein JXR71_05630 [Bacteroidales bacterium]|nr:hypothetical protein [Bacteroidales bacterium]